MAQKKKPSQASIKVSVPLPPDVHMALGLAGVKSGISNSTLIGRLVQERFVNGDRSPLKSLKPDGAADWKRVSVFLPESLKNRATAEVQRQQGSTDDKRATGSLAAAIAGLVAKQYGGKVYKSA